MPKYVLQNRMMLKKKISLQLQAEGKWKWKNHLPHLSQMVGIGSKMSQGIWLRHLCQHQNITSIKYQNTSHLTNTLIYIYRISNSKRGNRPGIWIKLYLNNRIQIQQSCRQFPAITTSYHKFIITVNHLIYWHDIFQKLLNNQVEKRSQQLVKG